MFAREGARVPGGTASSLSRVGQEARQTLHSSGDYGFLQNAGEKKTTT